MNINFYATEDWHMANSSRKDFYVNVGLEDIDTLTELAEAFKIFCHAAGWNYVEAVAIQTKDTTFHSEDT